MKRSSRDFLTYKKYESTIAYKHIIWKKNKYLLSFNALYFATSQNSQSHLQPVILHHLDMFNNLYGFNKVRNTSSLSVS